MQMALRCSLSTVSIRALVRPSSVYFRVSRATANDIDFAVDEQSGKCHVAVLLLSVSRSRLPDPDSIFAYIIHI